MPDTENNHADAAFAELDAVAAAFRRLQQTPVWKTDARRLSTALQDIIGALAQAAFAEFPDERRWPAGARLFGMPDAFKDAATGVTSEAWRAALLQVEADILGAPDAPERVVGAAFRNAVMRTINQLQAGDDPAAALETLDGLTARMTVQLSGPQLANETRSMLIATLERLDLRPELRARLAAMATSDDEKAREFAEGRLRVLDARETPLDLAFEDIAGEPLDLAGLRGKVVLLQFWASWCGPCRAELPHLRAAYAAHHDQGFQIVGLSLDRLQDDEAFDVARARVVAFMRENGMTWPSQFDGLWWNNAFAKRFGVRGIPASLLLDREGRVAALNLRGGDIGLQVERLLA